jgi:hypothetical protein
MCISKPTAKLRVVQGWSTNCAAGVHRNRIMPHQVEVALQGNA